MGDGHKMGQRDRKRDTVLAFFYNYPSRNFQLRELSRLTKIPKSTLLSYLSRLVKEDLVLKEKKGLFSSYIANESNFFYKYHKRDWLIKKIYLSGIIDFLEDEVYPEVIFLFGSAAKGEYVENSDIDLFVLSKEKRLVLKKFERRLGKKINLLFKDDFSKLSKELSNNIINGYKMSGYLRLR